MKPWKHCVSPQLKMSLLPQRIADEAFIYTGFLPIKAMIPRFVRWRKSAYFAG